MFALVPKINKLKPPTIKELWTRRVPQLLGAYILAMVAILEFVSLLCERYLLSPHLIDFTLTLFLSIIPALTLIIYHHGAKGNQPVKKSEKVVVPVNIVVTAVLLFMLFHNQSLRPLLTTVTYYDDNGQLIEESVPNPEFCVPIVLFPFDLTYDDSTYKWLEVGIPTLISFDLVQDPLVNPIGIEDDLV